MRSHTQCRSFFQEILRRPTHGRFSSVTIARLECQIFNLDETPYHYTKREPGKATVHYISDFDIACIQSQDTSKRLHVCSAVQAELERLGVSLEHGDIVRIPRKNWILFYDKKSHIFYFSNNENSPTTLVVNPPCMIINIGTPLDFWSDSVKCLIHPDFVRFILRGNCEFVGAEQGRRLQYLPRSNPSIRGVCLLRFYSGEHGPYFLHLYTMHYEFTSENENWQRNFARDWIAYHLRALEHFERNEFVGLIRFPLLFESRPVYRLARFFMDFPIDMLTDDEVGAIGNLVYAFTWHWERNQQLQ